MRKISSAIILTFIILACEQPTEIGENSYEPVEILKTEVFDLKDDEKISDSTNTPPQHHFRIHYPLFEITISHNSFYEDRVVNQIKNDTTLFYLDLAEYLDSATIEIHHDGIHTVDIYQMYQNSITIMNEGPHCDLVDWKHYNSDWIAIKKFNDYDFIAESYNEKDWGNFIEVDIPELQNAVLEHCGEEWAERVANLKEVNDYPSSVGMNRIVFKIEMTHPKSQIKTQQIIVFEIPMGC